jgi:hypothetical protein
MAFLTPVALAVLIGLVVVVGISAPASPAPITEAQVKAGFLYNFAMFVEWPAGLRADEPLVIAVLGEERFAGALKQIEGRIVNGRKIAVKFVDQSDDLTDCAILYISAADDRSAAAALSRVGGAPVLTVGEAGRFTELGGIVRLYTENSKLRFEINVTRSQRAKLRISSKLLGLARIVREAI